MMVKGREWQWKIVAQSMLYILHEKKLNQTWVAGMGMRRWIDYSNDECARIVLLNKYNNRLRQGFWRPERLYAGVTAVSIFVMTVGPYDVKKSYKFGCEIEISPSMSVDRNLMRVCMKFNSQSRPISQLSYNCNIESLQFDQYLIKSTMLLF